MLRWLSAQGARLRAADSRSKPPGAADAERYVDAGQIFCGAFSDALLEGIELIAISPGVPLRNAVVATAVARGIPVVGDIELFAQQLRIQDSGFRAKVIAITGANGKTTVTSMVEHLCRAAGRDAVAAGNISPAVLDVVLERNAKQPEIWVLELSSFQLETTFSLNADAATVLNVSEDHLDRYAGMDEYAAAKARIFQGSGVQVLNRDDARSMGMAMPGRKVVTFGLTPSGLPLSGEENDAWGIEHDASDIWLMQGKQRLLKAGELQVAGLHNAANALAALALCRAIDLPLPVLLEALRSFRGLPHRVERVAEIGNVTYYDDSKGTNVGATIAALQGLGGMTRCAQASGAGVPPSRKIVLIAGGEGKGQDFAPLNPVVAMHARAVVLIGRDAAKIASALDGCGVTVVRAKDMSDAVQQASRLAHSCDAVLLSPACASFDMFRNYAHRAEMFVQAVHELTPPNPPLSGGEAIKEGAWSR
ncbi:MAG: UDP-N-acetylmuramoylalanine--D-glutamate ligase [Gallionellales bacterium RIFCSPLOWO2_02_FULL_57_47]|nr:MAG: UDP-N-acetylmuramoylalanine--D-glutamate ligase [Gallionellales bacterium RIFCSPLOWO2_02_FULL_57_47]OGT13404.1 MAG: UDP-N-acetylmuramoylalanine--D-glutamate ligase [Gallionellales bacterium RIFCSPHIGHO2_02_FULL_57_16]